MSNSRHFLHNDGENSLSTVISQILPSKAKSLDFLVGYFYFSGLQEIYQHLEDKPMRILVGIEMEQDLLQRTAEIDFAITNSGASTSRQQSKQMFYESLKRLFNETDYFEKEERVEAFRIYYDKIKNGTLEIRKTVEPCHAKMYIFGYKDELTEGGTDPGTVITGSSNLTYSGLRANNEINVRFKDKPEFDEAENIFNRLWENALIIADKDHLADFEEKVVNQVWYEKIPSPYLLYLRALYEYFHIDDSNHIATPSEITHGEFKDLRYQEDAIRLAVDAIKRHNGVIIADVVGLGKSIIASAVANNLHCRTIIVSPPHLTDQWDDYRTQFGVNARVFSRGKLEEVLDFYKSARRQNEEWLILVDEAHAYRNEYIKDYAILHEICKGNKVILLTATPFNNRPADIYAMIKLFQDPTKTTLQTVDNLGREFERLIYKYRDINKKQKENRITDADLKKEIAKIAEEIRRIIGPLVIRRSRIDLDKLPRYKKDMREQGMEFSTPRDPESKEYDLGDLAELYQYTLMRIALNDRDIRALIDENEELSNEEIAQLLAQKLQDLGPTFQAARYKPLLYSRKEHREQVQRLIEAQGLEYHLFMGSQRNIASFMRTLLVHRFESSQYAFLRTLNNMLSYCENIQKWIEKRGKVPVFRKGKIPDFKALYESSSDQLDLEWEALVESQIQSLTARGMFEVPIDYLNESFGTALQQDIDLLKELKLKWDAVPIEHDPKLKSFISILKQQLHDEPNRKIIVFSQFSDTVEYLGEKLRDNGLPVFYYTSKRATGRNKEIIKANFDAGYPAHKQVDEYKILVATDAISEGYNLHRAGTVFNYDIPYNPTRVIQRVGRINRINKKVFDELYIYNYFPTSIGEIETRTKEITTTKMAMIHALMGEDTKYLTSDEELNNFFAEQYRKLVESQESESWDTAYRAFLHQKEDTEEMREALSIPLRTKIRRLSKSEETGIVAFIKRGSDFAFKMRLPEGKVTDLSPEDGFRIMKSEADEKGYKPFPSFTQRFTDMMATITTHEAEGDNANVRREAYSRVNMMKSLDGADRDYLEDLATAIAHDSISGYSLREINRLKPADFARIETIVSREYVQDALRAYDRVTEGKEALILAEDIQNINTDSHQELDL